MDKDESKTIIVDESSTEKSESECVHKIINKGIDAKNEAAREEPMVTDDPFFKEPIYFNIFNCGKNLLNNIDATCKQACTATPRYQ